VCVYKRITLAVKWVEFVSDRAPYIILRGYRCHIIVLNIHSPTVDKTYDVKDSFYEELEHIFSKLPKYQMKTVLGDINKKYAEKTLLNQQL
jgi:hypothetical protein